jgi:hypothetical protein
LALIGNFQERIVKQSNISLLKVSKPNLEATQIDIARKAYIVHEITHIYQLYVRQNQPSFIFDHFILIKECFQGTSKYWLNSTKNLDLNISIDKKFTMSMIIYNFIFHSYNFFSNYDYSQKILFH